MATVTDDSYDKTAPFASPPPPPPPAPLISSFQTPPANVERGGDVRFTHNYCVLSVSNSDDYSKVVWVHGGNITGSAVVRGMTFEALFFLLASPFQIKRQPHLSI